MKIVFFSRFFYPHIGGVEKHVLKISELLVKRGHSITVVTEKYDKKLPSEEFYKKIRIIRLTSGNNTKTKKYLLWKQLFRQRTLLKNADLIHCHDVFYWYFPFRFLYPLKKVYTTFHGYEGNSLPTKKAIFMHKIAEKLSMGNICIGDYLKKWYGTHPTFVSYGAAETGTYAQKQDIKEKAVFIGRLEKETGIIEYLRALKKLREKNISLSLTVLGDGSLGSYVKNYAKKNNLRVRFNGFVPEIYRYAYKSEYIFTSRFLGSLEAFALKKFVFAVYNNDIKRDCFAMSPFKKFISLSNGADSLVKEIMYYRKEKKERNEKVTRAFDWVSKQTWNKLTNTYEKLWNL